MRRTYHHGDLREALLDAALRGLDKQGELPSWRALARDCGVSQTAPYRHFANFEVLQVAVAAACFERLTEAVRAATVDLAAPRTRLAAGLRAYVQFGRSHPSWYELMFGRPLASPPNAAVNAAATEAFMALVDGVAACGVRDPGPPAFTLWCAVHGITDLAASGRTAPVPVGQPRALLEQVITMCMAHVTAVSARAGTKK